jgi:hypothetical protein
MSKTSTSPFYTDRFLEAMLISSRNASINSKQQTPCCSIQNNECSEIGELPKGFYFNTNNRYDFVIMAIKLYDILLETKSPFINFIHFAVGLCGDWELLASSLDKTLLTSACAKGQEWRDGSVLGNGPIPYFQPITSAYGDLLFSYLSLLFSNKVQSSFILGQLQEAYVQMGSECVINIKYIDSKNFNPRSPFKYGQCTDIWEEQALPSRNRNRNRNDTSNIEQPKQYPLSFIPQMVWHAFILDFFIFLDPDYVITHDTRRVMRRGVKLLQNRKVIKETCIKMIAKLRLTFKELFGEDVNSGENLHNLLDNKELLLLLKTANSRLLQIIIDLILKWLKKTDTNISSIPLKELKDKINSFLDNSITSLSESRDVLNKAGIVMDNVIQGLTTNQLTDELFRDICLFYNETCGLLFHNEFLRDSALLSRFTCN